MLARCTHCESTFVTSQFGRQRCPKCGVEVIVEDPRADTAGAYAPPQHPPMSEVIPGDALELTPWERRSELGFFPALGQTFSAALGRPGPFFSRMRYDVDEGALLYFFIVGIIPSMLKDLFEWLTWNVKESEQQINEALTQLQQSLPPNQPPAVHDGMVMMSNWLKSYMGFEGSIAGLLSSLVGFGAASLLGLFFTAGIVHGTLLLFGKAKGGWTATFKATVYASTPLLLCALPVCCGWLIGATWATGLQIYGIARGHRISLTWATVGVLGFHGTLTLCCGGVIFALLALGAAQQVAH